VLSDDEEDEGDEEVHVVEGEGLEAAELHKAAVDIDLNYDPDMVPGVETGNDVVEFYGKYGKESAVKFFYCNR
jgi:dynein heavy chain, axonemal